MRSIGTETALPPRGLMSSTRASSTNGSKPMSKGLQNRRIPDALAAIVLLCGMAPLAHGQCSSPAAATKIVHVEFIGCSAEMATDVVVTIGTEPILVSKPAGATFWRGEAADT